MKLYQVNFSEDSQLPSETHSYKPPNQYWRFSYNSLCIMNSEWSACYSIFLCASVFSVSGLCYWVLTDFIFSHKWHLGKWLHCNAVCASPEQRVAIRQKTASCRSCKGQSIYLGICAPSALHYFHHQEDSRTAVHPMVLRICGWVYFWKLFGRAVRETERNTECEVYLGLKFSHPTHTRLTACSHQQEEEGSVLLSTMHSAWGIPTLSIIEETWKTAHTAGTV